LAGNLCQRGLVLSDVAHSAVACGDMADRPGGGD
jgi:hypothetical protein